MKLEKEAEKYLAHKKKKLSAAQRTVMRVYMSSSLTGLLSSGRHVNADEVIREAYQYALKCVEFESKNF